LLFRSRSNNSEDIFFFFSLPYKNPTQSYEPHETSIDTSPLFLQPGAPAESRDRARNFKKKKKKKKKKEREKRKRKSPRSARAPPQLTLPNTTTRNSSSKPKILAQFDLDSGAAGN
jgi:hypothetical protein